MTLTKLFTNTFDEYMFHQGFQRKGKLYYRMNGDILQGVVLKATNPYSVCYTYFPHWTYSFRSPKYDVDALSKGYWAEIGEELTGVYYKKELTQADEAVMQTIFQLFSSEIISRLNSVCDLESYLHEVLISQEQYCERSLQYSEANSYEQIETPHIQGKIELNQYALLYQAAIDRSYDETDRILAHVISLQEKRERFHLERQNQTSPHTEDLIAEHIEMLMQICPDMSPEQMREDAEQIFGRKTDVEKEVATRIERYTSSRFSTYRQQKELNDFAMIEAVYAKACETMAEALHQAFPKLVF